MKQRTGHWRIFKLMVKNTSTDSQLITHRDKDKSEIPVKPDYMNIFEETFGEFLDDEPDLFPEFEAISPVEPSTMEVNAKFSNKKSFIKHLKNYCVITRCQYKLSRSAPWRVKAECRFKTEWDCDWFVYASIKNKESTFVVRKVNLTHKCEGDHKNRNRSADPHFVKDFVLDQLKNCAKIVIPAPHKIKDDFLATMRVNIPYICAWKARNLVLQSYYGSYDESYNEIPALCGMVTKCNVGSIAKFTWDTKEDTFESMTLSFEPAMRGFHQGCRGAIGLDACHLTGEFGGVLMAATILDGQNGLVPLGIMVCRSETRQNWETFLNDLKPGISEHPVPVTFISDRQKGLLEAVPNIFPGVQHRYCWRHLYKNFKKYYKGLEVHGLLWNAAKAYKTKHFQEHMDNMKVLNANAWGYLMKEDPSTWSRAFFNPIHCCEHMNNNFSESFNNMIEKLRDKPICTIGIMYANLVMGLWYKRRTRCESWVDGDLVPKAMELINKMLLFTIDYHVDPSVAGEIYSVTSPKNSVFIVNLVAKTCSCLQWQLRGFPCMHSVSALQTIRPKWRKYCGDFYSVENYRATYAPTFNPLNDKADWVKPNMKQKKILHPPHSRKTGRPKSKRVRSYDEPKTEKRKRKCGKCGSTTGHNSRTCAGGEVGSNPTGKRPRTECDATDFTFTNRQQGETSKVRGKATSKGKIGKASFVGENSTSPSATPSTAPSSTGPILSQNFNGVGYVSQNINQSKGKAKKQGYN